MKAILLIDHGSRRAAANAMLHDVAALVGTLARSDLIVEPSHMELAEPSIADGFAACVRRGATEVIAVPYMLSPGRHVTEDIPRLVAEAAGSHHIPFRVASELGVHAGLASVVLERAGINEAMFSDVDARNAPRPTQ